MPSQPPVYLYDGILELDGGMNSGIESQLLEKNEVAFMTNGFLDTGFITQRPPTNKIAITATDPGIIQAATKGWFYGATCYTSDAGVPSIIASIGGQLFRFTPQYQTNPTNPNFGQPLNQVIVDNQTGTSGGQNTTTALQHWLRQAERWVLWHDGISLPLYWDGSANPPTIRRSVGPAGSPPELPAGRMLTYGLGRVWQALPDGFSFMAGDIVNWSSGTLAYNFRDAVLKASSNQLLAGGGNFRVPGNVGTIQALVFIALLDASLGQGPLQVFAQQTVFSCNAPVDQSTWQSLTNPILTESVKAAGGAGQDSTILANGDILYRSPDGQIRSLVMARLDFNRWGNSPISLEVTKIIETDNTSLLPFGSGVNFDNGAMLTTGPVQGPLGIYHTGLVSLCFDQVSLMREKYPPAYNGLWTGWNILSIVTGMFYNVQRCFAFTYNTATNAIELHEFLSSTSAQYADDGTKPITMQFSSAALFWKLKGKSEFDLVKLEAGEMAVQEIQGFNTFTVEFKSVYDPNWHPWTTWSVDNTSGNIPYAPRMGLGIPPTTNNCNSATNRPYEVDYAFQVRVTITGKCRFMGLRLKASLMPQQDFAQPLCPPSIPVPPPSAPTDLQATISGNDVLLTWNASNGGGVTYNIYRNTTEPLLPGPGTLIATGITGTSYTDTGTALNTTYNYTATANNTAGHSNPAPHAHIHTPATFNCSGNPSTIAGLVWSDSSGQNGANISGSTVLTYSVSGGNISYDCEIHSLHNGAGTYSSVVDVTATLCNPSASPKTLSVAFTGPVCTVPSDADSGYWGMTASAYSAITVNGNQTELYSVGTSFGTPSGTPLLSSPQLITLPPHSLNTIEFKAGVSQFGTYLSDSSVSSGTVTLSLI